MTTIAYNHKDKEIAIDSRATRGDLIFSDSFDKVIKSDHATFFITGVYCDSNRLVSAYLGENIDMDNIECSAFVIDTGSGCVFEIGVDDGKLWMDKLTENFATGSGEAFALAAMDFGKDAQGAVEYAMTRDCKTGGEVRVFGLDGSLKWAG